jgi:hypothetical protein
MVITLVAILLFCLDSQGLGKSLTLQKAAIIVDANEASFVHYSAQELTDQIQRYSGQRPTLYYDLEEALQSESSSLVIIGRTMADRLGSLEPSAPRISDESPGRQGFILRVLRFSHEKSWDAVVVTGSDSEGTNYGVMQLRQVLLESESGLSLEPTLSLNERPAYPIRAVYIHKHWLYNYPYATSRWMVEDWKRMIDVLAYLRVNVVMHWTRVDVVGSPPSVADRDLLEDFHTVIDYAHRKRGIEVWTIEAANVVFDHEEVQRVPFERRLRDYYAYAHMSGGGLKNPADPIQLNHLLANREILFRLMSNADGHAIIDSDPGGWLGSTAREFVDILESNQRLLKKWQPQRQPKLVYWLLFGWGNEGAVENFREVIRGMQKRVPDPWELLLCFPIHFQVAQELKVIHKSVFFPYGTVEPEPSLPLTRVRFEEIRRVYDFADQYPGLKGTMANTQTLLAQLPNIYYITECAWNNKARNFTNQAALQALAKLIAPQSYKSIATAWTSLSELGSTKSFTSATELETLVQKGDLGQLGTVGHFLLPDYRHFLRDLAIMVRVHAQAERVRETVEAGAEQNEVFGSLREYVRELLNWQKRTGFVGAYGPNKQVVYDRFMHGPDYQLVRDAWQKYSASRKKELEAIFLKSFPREGFEEWIVQSMVGQLFGTYEVKLGPIEQKIVRQGIKAILQDIPWQN